MLKNKDFIEIEYTGKLKDDNAVFDTTNEKVAKDNDVFSKNMKYEPAIICLGEHQVIKGIDDFLIGKDIGKHTIELEPEQAFGKKDAKLLKIVNTNIFKKQKINPMPGLQVDMDGTRGTIRTVTGGRTIVDFNHPLSGRDLVYEVDVKRIVSDTKEKLESFIKLELNFDPKKFNIEIKEGKASFAFEGAAKFPDELKDKIKEKIIEIIPEIKDLIFEEQKKEVEKKRDSAPKASVDGEKNEGKL